MEESFDDMEVLYLTDKEIFLRIWTSPRLVFKYINDNDYGKYVTILLLLAGIYSAFGRAINKDMGDSMPLWGVLAICIIGGGLLGWISYYIYAALVSWTGGLLHGEGDTDSILRIMSYATLPQILTLVPLFLRILVSGNEVFQSGESSDWISVMLLFGSSALGVCLSFWALALAVIGVSEVQKLSIWKSALNLLLPILILGVPILLLILLFKSF